MVYMQSLRIWLTSATRLNSGLCASIGVIEYSQNSMTRATEKKEGLPVSMLCDRDSTWQDESSVNFIDFIVCPFLSHPRKRSRTNPRLRNSC